MTKMLVVDDDERTFSYSDCVYLSCFVTENVCCI